MKILDNIPFELDVDLLLSRLHVGKGSEDAENIQDLVETVSPVASPKAIYKVCYIQSKGYDTVKIGGVTFSSRVLRVNLDKVERVFPYIATCGRELDETISPSDDFIRQFWLDTIKGMALETSVKYLKDYLKRKYALGDTSSMAPGAGDQDLWPIEQQRQLFSLFANVEDLIGVKLTDSFLMIPNKSVSGLCFPTEIRFESCQLCARRICAGRRAPYDKNLVESYYKER
jgi:hypothetical protein